jgi:hypothetical protein
VAQLSTLGHVHTMNIIRFIFGILLAVSVLAVGCASKPGPDPLAGWHTASHNPDQAIDNDYHDYIQKLPPEERKYAGPVLFHEDGTGRHAIEIEIGINGTSWEHILIYDQNDKRIKTIKYMAGHYAS